MEIKRSNRNITKKRLIIIVVTLLLVLSAVGVYFITQKQQESSKKTPATSSSSDTPALDTPAKDEEVQTGNDAKDNIVNGNEAPASEMSVNTTASYTGDTVRIITDINKITSQGSCNVTLTQGDKTVKKEQVSIQPLPSYSTCNGWDIASSELSPGKWIIAVSVTSGSQSASGTAEVNL